MAKGFQDRMDGLRDDAQRRQEQAEHVAARQRYTDYQNGQATAADIIGRVAAFGSSFERNTATLRQAAARQPRTLAGSVAAGELAAAAGHNESITPDTQAEARRIAALQETQTVSQRIAAARAQRADRVRANGLDREREQD